MAEDSGAKKEKSGGVFLIYMIAALSPVILFFAFVAYILLFTSFPFPNPPRDHVEKQDMRMMETVFGKSLPRGFAITQVFVCPGGWESYYRCALYRLSMNPEDLARILKVGGFFKPTVKHEADGAASFAFHRLFSAGPIRAGRAVNPEKWLVSAEVYERNGDRLYFNQSSPPGELFLLLSPQNADRVN